MPGFAGIAAKALPMLVDNAPELWSAATQLIQSVRRAKAEIPVEAEVAARSGGVDAAGLEAAIRDIEASLLTLNAQMEKTGTLVASLARQNEALQARTEKLQGWVVGLAVATGFSLALALGAVVVVLGR